MTIEHLKHGQPFYYAGVLCYKVLINHVIQGHTAFLSMQFQDAISYMPNGTPVTLVR